MTTRPPETTEEKESWKKRLVRLFIGSDNPVKDALSFSTGLGLAFLPPFGFHSVLMVFLAYVFRLSLPLGLLGSWVNNPWTFFPVFLPAYFVEIKVGSLLTRHPVTLPNLHALSEMPESAILAQVRLVLYPFFVGSILLSAVAFAASFPVVYLLIRWLKSRRINLVS